MDLKAHKRALNHWQIDKNSIYKKNAEGNKVSLCLVSFILEFKEVLEIPTDLLPTYLEEINTTLYTTAYKIANEKHTSSDFSSSRLPNHRTRYERRTSVFFSE